jgi:hypothetical protein
MVSNLFSGSSVPKVFQKSLIQDRCSRILPVFMSLSVELFESFPHHVQLGLAVPLEDLRIALPQHSGFLMRPLTSPPTTSTSVSGGNTI